MDLLVCVAAGGVGAEDDFEGLRGCGGHCAVVGEGGGSVREEGGGRRGGGGEFRQGGPQGSVESQDEGEEGEEGCG